MGIQIVSLFPKECNETNETIDGETETMMKSVDTYYSEIFDELCDSELAQYHDFNNGDIDHLIIDEIHARIPATDTEKWIMENPDSVEARTLLWIT